MQPVLKLHNQLDDLARLAKLVHDKAAQDAAIAAHDAAEQAHTQGHALPPQAQPLAKGKG